MPTIPSIGRPICERKGVKSAFDANSFQRQMTFIGHWAGFLRRPEIFWIIWHARPDSNADLTYSKLSRYLTSPNFTFYIFSILARFCTVWKVFHTQIHTQKWPTVATCKQTPFPRSPLFVWPLYPHGSHRESSGYPACNDTYLYAHLPISWYAHGNGDSLK